MSFLVLLRHGESQWNHENRFTGWVDVDLSAKGENEAQSAGKLIKKSGLIFQEVHTSILKRAIRTSWLVLEQIDQTYLEIKHSWRLNERHYGALQGLNKDETSEKYGPEQVFIWRRSYDIAPPPMPEPLYQNQLSEQRLKKLLVQDIPRTESLLMCQQRVLPYWEQTLAPALKQNQNLLVVAHGNSLRALIKLLDQIPDLKIAELNIPTGQPLVYEFDPKTIGPKLGPMKYSYLN
ncbi:MAG: 2,3-diphosphoglycerate-dependent phosphoglycerate mutase [Bdellovibrionales bacterium]|nr:2,3-diphosphoglycerate-dependent phosphoglycerate mutase [Bdellovibrionales bacterium]